MPYIGTFLQIVAILAATGIVCVAPGILLIRSFVNDRRILRSPFCWVLAFVCGYGGYTVMCDFLGRYCARNCLTLLIVPPVVMVLLGLGVSWKRAFTVPVGIDLSWRQMAACAVLACVVVMQALPFETKSGIYWGAPYDDYVKHAYIINAVARTGCPPLNPIYAPLGDQYLFYYYGFSLLPGALVGAFHIDTTVVLFTFAALVATCFVAICVAMANWLTGAVKGGWIALALCLVTGLDLPAILILEYFGKKVFPGFEWWNYGQVVAILGFLVWVPQHVMASNYVLIALLLLGAAVKAKWNSAQMITIIMLVVACGMTSTYVAMALFGALLLILLMSWFRRTSIGGRGTTAMVFLVGLVLLLPFYIHLAKIDQFAGPGIRPVFRPFVFDGEAARWAFFEWFDRFQPYFGALQAYRVLTLPVQYFLEFGFWVLVAVAWLYMRKTWGEKHEIMSRMEVMSVCALLIGSVFVSVRMFADLNWRILQPFQAILVVVGAEYLVRIKPLNFGTRPFLATATFFTIYLGVMGTITSAVLLRINAEESPFSNNPIMSKRAHAAAPLIESVTPTASRVQYNPSCHGNPPWPMYLHRQIPISDSWFNAMMFGVSGGELRNVAADINAMFSRSANPGERLQIIDKYKIDYVLLQKEDVLFDKPLPEILPGRHEIVCSGEDWKLIDARANP